MAYLPRILAFAGSTRTDSLNKRLLRSAVQGARSSGAEVTLLDLRDFPLPLYDGDLEADSGLPENAQKIKALLKSNDGFLVSAPEYNSSISGVLKNAIDWASRSEAGEPPLACFKDKAVGLLSASPGALAGLRGLAALRSIFHNIGCHVIPTQFGLPRAHEAFDQDGNLKDPKQQAAAENIGAALAKFLKHHHA